MTKNFLSRYMIAGLLVWLPIIATVWVVRFILDLLNNSLALVPAAYQPDYLLRTHIPGAGVVLTLVIIFLTGVLTANFIGTRFINLFDNLVNRIPFVRSVHTSVKQLLKALFSSPEGRAFHKVVLIEYPRKGTWSIGFETGNACEEANQKLNEEMVSVFIMATPNPTSGFLVMVSRQELIELDMTVEQGLKFVVSLGVVKPQLLAKKKKDE